MERHRELYIFDNVDVFYVSDVVEVIVSVAYYNDVVVVGVVSDDIDDTVVVF